MPYVILTKLKEYMIMTIDSTKINMNSLGHILHKIALDNKLSSFALITDLYRTGFISGEQKKELIRSIG